MERPQLSSWQFFLLTISHLIGSAFFYIPSTLVGTSKQISWILPLIAGAFTIIIACLWLHLASQYPKHSLIQICLKVGGKYVGCFFALLYIWYCLQITSWVTRDIGNFAKMTLLPHTPITMFHIMFLLIICYASIKGIDTIARTNELLLPIVIITLFILFLLTIPDWKWERFEPLLPFDWNASVKNTSNLMAFPFFESFTLMIIIPYVKNKAKKNFLLGMGCYTLLLSMVTFFIIGTLGVVRSSHAIYPLYTIMQEIQISPLIEHLESTISMILLTTIFVKISITYYCCVLGICQLFQLKDRTWVSIPLILLVSGIAMAFEDIVEDVDWYNKYAFANGALYGIILPLILLAVSGIRKFSNRQKENIAK
ncbi:GerAB/ArcD/ProY family transporter [Shimazuella kribbensis]|uniref:GerAB/ArcD/ProY family transporter n=1 Tax=Shimazuella kribbensis TaxID=139808 RepID=UPI0003F5954D|nr:endospore germination permease [Shimazuella kribbensis]